MMNHFIFFFQQDWVVKYWKEKGAPKEKLVLGFPTYGRSFTLSDTSNYGINAPIRGVGKSQYIKNGGLMPYFEVSVDKSHRIYRIVYTVVCNRTS